MGRRAVVVIGLAAMLGGCFIADERARRTQMREDARAARRQQMQEGMARYNAEKAEAERAENEAYARSWRGRFGRPPPDPEGTRAHCQKFFGGLDAWWPTMRRVIAANDPKETRDFLAVLDPCTAYLRLMPGSRRSVRGFESLPADGPAPARAEEIRRVLLVNQAYVLTGAPGQFWPLDRTNVGTLQLELLQLSGN